MAKSVDQKIKIMRIYDILRMGSDEKHPMSTNDILEKLSEEGVKCERKSLASDIELLKKYGYDVEEKRSRQRLYYVKERDLDVYAIRFLIDATQAAGFLSASKTRDIVYKLAMIAGTYKGEVLRKNILCFDKLKSTNNEVFCNITEIDEAIENGRKVSFEYCTLNTRGKPEPKTENGVVKRYKEAPIAMMFNGGFYYMIAWQEKHDDIVSYRIDRMMSVKAEEEFLPNNAARRFKSGDLKDSMTAFGMWSGKTRSVTMRFPDRHAGDVFDKFGRDVRLYHEKDGHFVVTANVNPDDPVFLGWCMSYGSELEIISPHDVRKALADKAAEICEVYAAANKQG